MARGLTLAFATLAAASAARADTLAYWRFEDHPVGDTLVSHAGGDDPLTQTKSFDNANALRTFNTKSDIVPPNTSGTFVAPADLPPLVDGAKNERCVRFIGREDFYTAEPNKQPAAIDSAKLPRFTVEGLFKLAVLSERFNDQYQSILGKDGQPVGALPFQPFVVVVGGQDDQYNKRDCLAVHIIDRGGNYRTAGSQAKLERDHWYAFAAVCDGGSLKLYINRFDGRGYQLEGESPVDGGLIDTVGTWTVGRGQLRMEPNSWLQGCADEIRISDAALPPEQFITAGVNELPTPTTQPIAIVPKPPTSVVGLADPVALFHDGVYYLYGTTSDTDRFGVWSSRDLKQWTKGPTILEKGPGVWGDSAFWAPGIVGRNGKFYLYYSASGILPYAGGPRTTRINLAVSDSPTGPFTEVVPRMPLIGRAVIDPQPFIDDDGTPYLYFVGDVSEGDGQIYVARLSDDMTGIIGEPVKCIEHSQPWEGGRWNEGPFVIRDGDTYILMYSGEFWASPDYAVGFATAPSPLGPWKKYDGNPILHRYAGLTGTGHNCAVRAPDGKGWLTFFHAHRARDNADRDTYLARLVVERDRNGNVVLKVEPWEPKP